MMAEEVGFGPWWFAENKQAVESLVRSKATAVTQTGH
jgi:hypothetical protein